MGGKSGQTIGYHYMFDILFGLCRGPLNELVEIKTGDRTTFKGAVTNNDIQKINKPELFGGEKKEGGIQGPFSLFMGAEDQILPGARSINVGRGGPNGGNRSLPNVKTAIGGLVSEFRGTAMLWFSGLVSSMNPYPKEWEFRVRRSTAGWWQAEPWYPEKAYIFMDAGRIVSMNPAHIIYECLTNPIWGRGLPAGMIDENSFTYAANKLCTENFGLCFIWQRKEEVDQFIAIVIDHIAANLYTDPESGKMVLRLIRDDYILADLPTFTPTSGLLDISDDDSGSQDEIFNEIIGTGHDPRNNEDFTARVHNLAARQSQGSPNPLDKNYSGVPTRELLVRVLQRDLKIHASGLKKFTVVLDRSGWKIRPGMPFRVQDPRRGYADLVLRAGEITDQSFRDGRITIKCVQDVYGLPASSYVTPVESSWLPPSTVALPATQTLLLEANYRDIVKATDVTTANNLDPGVGLIGTVSISPDSVMFEYDLATRVTGEPEFTDNALGPFSGAATLVDDITPLQTDFDITGIINLDEDNLDQMILLANADGTLQEQIGLTAIVGDTLTVVRGAGDTVPQAWPAATTLWTLDDDITGDARPYEIGETVEAKILTRTNADLLDEDLAPTETLEVVGRQEMPYPPGGVTVDGDSIFELAGIYPEPEIAWTDRDRLLQEDQIVGHGEASVGPEAGVTYTIRVYPLGNTTTPLRTESALAGSPFTYDATMQTADGGPSAVSIELESERDGKASYQHYRFDVALQEATAIAVFDFENGVYEVNGDPITLDDIDPALDPAAIVAGVGLVAGDGTGTTEWTVNISADVIAAMFPLGTGTGVSSVAEVDYNPTTADDGCALWVTLANEFDGYAWEYYSYWQESFPFTGFLADWNNAYEDFDPVAKPSKIGATFASTGLIGTYDGETSLQIPPPLDDVSGADTFTILLGAYDAISTLKKITFYTPMDAATLEAAATP